MSKNVSHDRNVRMSLTSLTAAAGSRWDLCSRLGGCSTDSVGWEWVYR